MQIRVTLAAPSEISAQLLAQLPGVMPTEAKFGTTASVLLNHDDPVSLRDRLRTLAGDIAVAVVTGPLATQPARLLLMDVDSTLTTTEAVDLLAAHAGAGARVAEITERAMRGELDFRESLRERVATLAGLPVTVFDEVAAQMTLSPGALELIAAAKQAGAVIGVTSGGFTQLVAPLANRLGLDFYNANLLETENIGGVERLTGHLVGHVVDREQKARDLAHFAAQHQIAPALTVAVGDGANDVGMFGVAGLSVAYCAKPVVAKAADAAIGFPRLDAVAPMAWPG